MTRFIFYDLETSGLNKMFDQIFQFAAVLTDSNLNIIDEFENKTSVMLQNIKMDVKLSNKIFIPDFYDEQSD